MISEAQRDVWKMQVAAMRYELFGRLPRDPRVRRLYRKEDDDA